MQKRQMRLADEIRDLMANSILHRISDPRVAGTVITHIKLSPDLQIASVYFRVYNDVHRLEDVLKGLQSCTGVFRKVLSDALEMRRIPELKFFYDESIEEGARIESLLSKIKS